MRHAEPLFDGHKIRDQGGIMVSAPMPVNAILTVVPMRLCSIDECDLL